MKSTTSIIVLTLNYNAREMNRVIKKHIEDPLVALIHEHDLKSGDKIRVGMRANKIKFSHRHAQRSEETAGECRDSL